MDSKPQRKQSVFIKQMDLNQIINCYDPFIKKMNPDVIDLLKFVHNDIKGHDLTVKNIKKIQKYLYEKLNATHSEEIKTLKVTHSEEIKTLEVTYSEEIKKLNENNKKLNEELSEFKEKLNAFSIQLAEVKPKPRPSKRFVAAEKAALAEKEARKEAMEAEAAASGTVSVVQVPVGNPPQRRTRQAAQAAPAQAAPAQPAQPAPAEQPAQPEQPTPATQEQPAPATQQQSYFGISRLSNQELLMNRENCALKRQLHDLQSQMKQLEAVRNNQHVSPNQYQMIMYKPSEI